jgi:hypothetical protein
MSPAEREAITAAARRHAAESAKAQGLTATIQDPDVLATIAALICQGNPKAAAA